MKILILPFAAMIGVVGLCMSHSLMAQEPGHHPTPHEYRLLGELRDDGIAGNCGLAFHHLRNRGSIEVLEHGLESSDWQQRLLSAVLLAQGDVPKEQLDLLCRILIWHLEDNEIRGDAMVAEHALVVLGKAALPWLEAALWHRDGAFAKRAEAAMSLIRKSGDRKNRLGRSQAALQNWTPSLRWLGDEDLVLGLSAPLPTFEQRCAQSLMDLSDDQREGNAVKEFDRLRWIGYKQNESLEFLWSGLSSSDRQQRVLSASLLMRFEEAPRPALFRVAVECLEQDIFGSPRTLNVGNADLAQNFFLQYPKQSSAYLLPALEATALTPRLRAAAILAQIRCPETHRYVPLLIERLQDNDFPEDAVLAGQSLVLLGPMALPWLMQEPKDAQQAHYFQVIRKAIDALGLDPQARIPFSNAGMYHLVR